MKSTIGLVAAALLGIVMGIWSTTTGHPWAAAVNFTLAGLDIGILVGGTVVRRIMREVWKLP